jgi:hypothetical protein
MSKGDSAQTKHTNGNHAAQQHRAPQRPQSPAPPVKPQKHRAPEIPPNPRIPQLHLSPLSNGQELERQLKALANQNAVGIDDDTDDKRWQLARDARAVELAIGRELTIAELTLMLDEWCHCSILDSRERDVHLAAFLVEVRKVRVATGQGDTVNKAVDRVSKLSRSQLVQIPGMANAPESWRRLATMHREMFRLTGGNVYFLGCRDTAKASPCVTHQMANNINSILVKQRVIEIVERGTANRATRYRYLL